MWTAGFAVLSWAVPLRLDVLRLPGPGFLLLVVAAVLMAAAFVEFARARTSVIPRRKPDALIRGGIFRVSRNPIYLADLCVLLGLSLMWGTPLGIVLVPVLGWVLTRRFILEEEAGLTAAFGDDFRAYSARTRRWL